MVRYWIFASLRPTVCRPTSRRAAGARGPGADGSIGLGRCKIERRPISPGGASEMHRRSLIPWFIQSASIIRRAYAALTCAPGKYSRPTWHRRRKDQGVAGRRRADLHNQHEPRDNRGPAISRLVADCLRAGYVRRLIH